MITKARSLYLLAGLLVSSFIYVAFNHPQMIVVQLSQKLEPKTKTETQVKPVDWKTFNVSAMTPADIVTYYEWANCSACKLFQDFGGVVIQNPTALDGQKSICLDRGVAPPPGQCLIYSFGINNEWSFDDVMEKYGCSVYAFDPSMEAADHNRTEKIHFFRTGLSGKDEERNDQGWKVKTLSSIYSKLKPQHGAAVIDYLKIDIEWAEWDVIPQIIRSGMLDNIRQMGIEIHLYSDKPLEEQLKYVSIIKSIEDHGMVRFNSKINPTSGVRYAMGVDGHFAYELAWYNSKFLPWTDITGSSIIHPSPSA